MSGEMKIALESYSKLLQTHQYHFVIGRKGIKTDITIDFNKVDLYHLLGLQYIIHISNNYELKKARSKIYDNLSDSDNTLSMQIENSEDYPSIKDRVLDVSEIEKILDKSTEIYKFNSHANGASKIEADYIVKFTDKDRWTYLLISEKKETNHYFCRSIFSRDKSSQKDFTNGHTENTFLLKEKIHIPTGRVEELYRAKSYIPDVDSAPKTENFSINNSRMTPRPVLAGTNGEAIALDFAQPPHGGFPLDPIKKFFSLVAKPFKDFIEYRQTIKEIRLLEDKLGKAETENTQLRTEYDRLLSDFNKERNEYSSEIKSMETKLEEIRSELKNVTKLSDRRGALLREANRILNENPELKSDYIRARDEHRSPLPTKHKNHEKPDRDKPKPKR